MSINTEDNSIVVFLRRLLSPLFPKERKTVKEQDPAKEVVKEEMDTLWNMIREKNEDEKTYSIFECRLKIMASFKKLRESFSEEQLDRMRVWPRYVLIAVNCCDDPIEDLVEYLNTENYIPLTKSLTDLSKHVNKGEEEIVKIRLDDFSKAVYLHILEHINSTDIPSLLFLGNSARKRGAYDEARSWYTKITETKDPFNGITAILSCYAEEIKEILSMIRMDRRNNYALKKRVRLLNERQGEIYKKWCATMEERMKGSESVSEKFKTEYVSLLTSYSRFERNRGNYEKAYELLKKIPVGYPDMYRVYQEEAMLYQFRPYRNKYYSLENAIETFRKAYGLLVEENDGAVCAKTKKSILMPLANTYFQAGRYNEASTVCDKVLEIDGREHRAINLKNEIESMTGATSKKPMTETS